MAKEKKSSKKKGKYDIAVKTNLTPDELFKKAINTPIKNSRIKKK